MHTCSSLLESAREQYTLKLVSDNKGNPRCPFKLLFQLFQFIKRREGIYTWREIYVKRTYTHIYMRTHTCKYTAYVRVLFPRLLDTFPVFWLRLDLLRIVLKHPLIDWHITPPFLWLASWYRDEHFYRSIFKFNGRTFITRTYTVIVKPRGVLRSFSHCCLSWSLLGWNGWVAEWRWWRERLVHFSNVL